MPGPDNLFRTGTAEMVALGVMAAAFTVALHAAARCSAVSLAAYVISL